MRANTAIGSSRGRGPDRYCPADHTLTLILTTAQYFGESDFETVGEAAFKKQLWQCMVGQASPIRVMVRVRVMDRSILTVIYWVEAWTSQLGPKPRS